MIDTSIIGKAYPPFTVEGEKLVDLEIAAQNQKGENIQLGKTTIALTWE